MKNFKKHLILIVLFLFPIVGCGTQISERVEPLIEYDSEVEYNSEAVNLNEDYTEEIKKYDFIGNFSEGYAVVEKDGQYGYINHHGEEIIELKYDHAKSFDNGYAIVMKDNQYGFINEDGVEITELKYDYADFRKDYGVARKKNDEYVFINQDGEEVTEIEYSGRICDGLVDISYKVYINQ